MAQESLHSPLVHQTFCCLFLAHKHGGVVSGVETFPRRLIFQHDSFSKDSLKSETGLQTLHNRNGSVSAPALSAPAFMLDYTPSVPPPPPLKYGSDGQERPSASVGPARGGSQRLQMGRWGLWGDLEPSSPKESKEKLLWSSAGKGRKSRFSDCSLKFVAF